MAGISKEQIEVTVESKLHPYNAIKFGSVLANVREKIIFLIQKEAGKKWTIQLVRGTKEDLLKAIKMATGVTMPNED